MKQYNLQFLPFDSSEKIQIGELIIPLPVKPAQKDMLNFGLKTLDQKWNRIEVPNEIRNYTLTPTRKDEDFIDGEWHKRANGIWVIIKGREFYFTGAYYTFLTYWKLPTGKYPSFREAQWKIFTAWDFVVRQPRILGLDLFKPRRVGATELTIFLLWEKASRTRGVHCGMQSKNEDTVVENYERLVKSHFTMVWFFKPISRGSTMSKEGLEFSYPETKITKNSLQRRGTDEEDSTEIDYTHAELGSKIDYQAAVSTGYDGSTLARYTLNEFGKIEKRAKMDPRTCWAIVRPTMELDAGQTIKGKALFESSVEEISEGEEGSIEMCQQMWDESNPVILDDNGMTISGKVRLFIGALESSKHDEWGFSQPEATRLHLENQLKALKKQNKTREMFALKRKFPYTIEDALMPSGQHTIFNAEKLNLALEQTDPFNSKGKPRAVRANLRWINGQKDGLVEILYTPNGNWEISQDIAFGHFSNSYEVLGSLKSPNNSHRYRIGVDPFDQQHTLNSKRSSGGMVVFRTYDEQLDGGKYDEDGMPFDGGKLWVTNQVVATYVNRPDDPAIFYEDVLMTCHYFGCQMLFENNKLNIKNHFINRGYIHYLQPRPKGTMSNYATRQQEAGIPAVEMTVNQYFDLLITYVERYYNCLHHPELINDMLQTNHANRKYHDLTVAFGWALMAAQGNYKVSKWEEKKSNTEYYDEYLV